MKRFLVLLTCLSLYFPLAADHCIWGVWENPVIEQEIHIVDDITTPYRQACEHCCCSDDCDEHPLFVLDGSVGMCGCDCLECSSDPEVILVNNAVKDGYEADLHIMEEIPYRPSYSHVYLQLNPFRCNHVTEIFPYFGFNLVL